MSLRGASVPPYQSFKAVPVALRATKAAETPVVAGFSPHSANPSFNTAGSRRQRGESERGFALLVVFLIAAGIMISLYLEIPRVAFESQRNREEMLLERGEQYSRAIEVFYRKNKRYPGKMEDLENTNNLRFLRKRYKDPLTGKDEWRIIHMGPAGQLADSLVEKPGQAGQQLAGSGQPGQTGLSGQPGQTGAIGVPGGPDELNIAQNRIRQSDRNPGGRGLGPGMPGYDPNNPNAGQQQQPQVDANGNPIFDPNQNQNQNPNQNPNFNPQSYNPNGQQNPQGQNIYAQAGQPGYLQPTPGQQPPGFGVPLGTPGQTINYQGGYSPGAQLQGQLAQQNGQYPAQPGQPGFGQNPALSAINNQLRNQAGFPQPVVGPGGLVAGQIPPGAVRLPDGTFRMPDGLILNADGTPKFQDPNQARPPGTPPPNGALGQNPFGSPSGFGNGTGSGFGAPQGVSGGQTSFGQALPTSQQSGQSFGGAGIAGVASTQAGVGIKRYNDHSKYKEWEFIFDYRKPKTKATTGVNGLKTSDLNQSNVIPGNKRP